MRRRLIQAVLPLLLCAIPVLAAAAVFSALESEARAFYLSHLTWMDVLILTVGTALFVVQMVLSLQALRWRGSGFDERPDAFLSHLAQGAEWFPLLGLLGTVAAILQTFGGMTEAVTPREIITRYAPAITATGSGLFMALINILPTWVVSVGRDLIRTLGGADEPAPSQRAAATPDGSRARPAAGSSPGTRSGSR